MIIVELMGGMGNQMFQWALGVALSKRGPVAYNASRLGPDKHRDFALRNLIHPIDYSVAPRISEPSLRFHSEILNTRGPATLFGYWQSEKYFAHVGDEIRAKFHVTYSSKLLGAIQAEPNSVFLHIRRTDYLAPGSVKFHGALDSGYYGAALSLIEGRVPGAHFFIFSDDPAWCRDAFARHNNATVVESGSAQEDMLLMSYCRHGITANSTFSWWGAWLNTQQENRIVVSPRKWFVDPQAQACSVDIVPERWIKL